MNKKTESEQPREADLEIDEINMDEACEVSGGSCFACGSTCSVEPVQPALNQL